MQRRLEVSHLPDRPLDAAMAFMALYLTQARSLLGDDASRALAIILPPADTAHSDWRRVLARDLAREYAPRRANVIAGQSGDAIAAMLRYLADAQGVTGHYCEVHDE